MKKIIKTMVIVLGMMLCVTNIDAKSDYIRKDKLGRVIEKREYHRNGKMKEKEVKTYYKNTREESSEKEWKYNTKGKRTSYVYEKSKVYWDKRDAEYDGMTIYKQVINYNNGIKKSQSIANFKNKKRTGYRTYTYNRKGVLKSNKYGKAKRVKYYYKNGKLSYKITASYNSKGKLGKGKKSVNKSKALSVSKIKQVALKKTNGGRITDFEVDSHRGKKVYEVEIKRNNYEYNLKISTTGSILEYDVEYDD